jgi:glycine cleavage system H protein
MATVRFTKEHEYIRAEDGVAVVGITNHAQEKLGDIVFVEVPEVGRRLAAGEAAGVVESVKAASDVFAPVAGEVVEANAELVASPQLVNEDAEGRGWFFKLRLDDARVLDGLLDEAAYAAFVAESE